MEGDECTTSCRSRLHGDELSRVLMSPVLTDADVLSYCTLKCRNFGSLINSASLSLAHVAAAGGRLQLLRYLLHLRDCLNDVDAESAYSLLHTSIWHGEVHCAVRLIQLGCKRTAVDNEFLSALEIAMKDRTQLRLTPDDYRQELYVWGSNTNYNLGCGHDRERVLPEPHDFFLKGKLAVKQVCLEKFHSVFVAVNGTAWACGLGGRAGVAMDSASVEPLRVPFSSTNEIISASVGEQHTLFLTAAGMAFSCGLNTHAVLGHPQRPTSLPTAKVVRGLPSLTGICASTFHSVFYTERQLFTCGTNHGQLGHAASEGDIISPREVTMIQMKGTTIQHVAASVGATVLLNSEGAVYLLSGFRCSRLTPKDWLRKGSKVAVVGGPTSDPTNDTPLRVVLLTSDCLLFYWREATNEMLPCTFSVRRQLKIVSLTLTTNGCIFSTADGEAFIGTFRDEKKSHMFKPIDVVRIAHIHRADVVASDSRGRNFAVLQHNPKISDPQLQILGLREFPEASSVRQDLGRLLEEANEGDNIHDAVFIIGGRRVAAHKYIIFYCNDNTTMRKLLAESKQQGDISEYVLNDVSYDAFMSVLRYVYTMEKPKSTRKEDFEAEQEPKKDGDIKVITEVRHVARRLGVAGLHQSLAGRTVKLNRRSGSYDVSLVSEEGTIVRAHRCVLVARLEFFQAMLMHGWRESSERELKVPVSGRVLEVLVEYLYTDRVGELEESTDVDFMSQVLMCADGLLCEGLKLCAARALRRMVSLRNVADLLQLSATCNADYFKSYAQYFILTNLTPLLESRCLEILPDERLEELSCIYKSWLPARRRLRNSMDDVEVVMVRSLAEAFPTVFPEDLQLAKPAQPPSSKTPKSKREKKLSEKTNRLSFTEEVSPVKVSPAPAVTAPVTPLKDEILVSPVTSPQVSVVQRRLKVITENAQAPPPREEMTPLTKSAAAISIMDFPELSSRPEKSSHPKTSSSSDLPKKFTKLSQRERRRLVSESSNDGDSQSKLVASPPKSVWAVIPPPGTTTPQASTSSNRFSGMSDIIDAERADRERLARMRSKPLVLTQMEDRALRELEVFYNAAAATEERITVCRVERPAATAAAPPIWPVSRPR